MGVIACFVLLGQVADGKLGSENQGHYSVPDAEGNGFAGKSTSAQCFVVDDDHFERSGSTVIAS
jgi:hypothetical protein